MEKLDELFEKYKTLFVKREDEIKQYLLKYKRDDFIKRDVIDIKRIDATERIKTSGFSKNLAMWQNFYKNVIVSTCIDMGIEQKRYDYKFYFTEEKIDSELLEKIEDIIKEINKLKKRAKFEEALSKVDLIEDMVKEKEDRYFNEQLRILRQEIKDAEENYLNKLQEIKILEEEVKLDRENQNFEDALEKSKKIKEIVKFLRKKDIQKKIENVIEEIKKEQVQKNIIDLEQKVKDNRSSERYNVAITYSKEIVELAESINLKDVKKKYLKILDEIEKEIQKEQEERELENKLIKLKTQFRDKKKNKNYDQALDIALEIIELSSLITNQELMDKYTQQKNEIIFILEEQHQIQQEKEIEDKIRELEALIEKSQETEDLENIIELSKNIIELSSSIKRDDITTQYKDLMEHTKNLIRKRLEQEKIEQKIEELQNELKINQNKKRLQKAILNCSDIIKLAQDLNDDELVAKYLKIREKIQEKIEKKNKDILISKKYEFNWDFDTSGAILTSVPLKGKEKIYLIYGGHEKKLYLLDQEADILNTIEFDGWVRCAFPIDFDKDDVEELLVGTGDGNMLVFELNEKEKKLFKIFHQKSSRKILCCTAGDLNRNGIMDFIYGGEGKKLYLYEGIQSKKPDFIFSYSSWVTSCAVGALKIPDFETPILGLLVGTQKGLLQLLYLENKDLEILWQKDLSHRINDIIVADVTNDGYNEIIVACDDYHVKILNSSGDQLLYIKTTEGRPLTLCVDDIDDDGAQELIVGGSHGKLSVYQNNKHDSTDIKLKWKTTGKTSIQSINSFYNKKEGVKQIIYGGYDGKIQSITDFEWGKKQKFEFIKKIKLPKSKEKNEKDVDVVHMNS